jgi:hypothetical protein
LEARAEGQSDGGLNHILERLAGDVAAEFFSGDAQSTHRKLRARSADVRSE